MNRNYLKPDYLWLSCAEKIILCVLSSIITIVFAVFVFNRLDRVPAAPEKYEELYNHLICAQDNPNEFLKHEGIVTIYSDKIVYEITNDECQIIGEFTRDYKLINYTQKDKCVSLSLALTCAIMLGGIAFEGSLVIIYIIMKVFETLFLKVKEVFKKKHDNKTIIKD